MEEHQTPIEEETDESPAEIHEKPKNDPEQPAHEPATGEVFAISRVAFNYVIIAIVFMLVGGVIGFVLGNGQAGNTQELIDRAVAAASSQFSEQVGEQVAAALDGVEVAGGADSGQRLDVSQIYDVTEGDDDDPYIGGADALVTIVEFSDFRCGFCGRFATTVLPDLLDRYGDQIRFVYRDYPIIGGASSYQAAMAAMCANEQGRFWDYHNTLFANQSQLGSQNALFLIAESGGLDMDSFRDCFQTEAYREGILADYNQARALNITGTPTFFINGRPVIGAQPLEVFIEVIDEELAAASTNTETEASG